MRSKILVLFFVFLLTDIYGQPHENEPSNKIKSFSLVSDSGLIYKTIIKLPGKTLTGLLIVKRYDSSHYKTAFISELGMSLFELDLDKDSVHLISYLDVLKKRDIIGILAGHVYKIVHPFTEINPSTQSVKRTIICYNFANLKYLCQTDLNNRIIKAKSGRGIKKVKINYTYLNKQFAGKITLVQNGFRIKWNLELLNEI